MYHPHFVQILTILAHVRFLSTISIKFKVKITDKPLKVGTTFLLYGLWFLYIIQIVYRLAYKLLNRCIELRLDTLNEFFNMSLRNKYSN